MSEIPMVERVARAICMSSNGNPDRIHAFALGEHDIPEWRLDVDEARAAIEAVRNHSFGDSFIIRHGSEPTAVLKGDVPQLILRHLIDLAMAEGPALGEAGGKESLRTAPVALAEEGREP